MARKLTLSEIETVSQIFKVQSPDCLSLYYLLKNSYRTGNTWPKLDVYMDSEDVKYLTSLVAIWYAHDEGDDEAELWYFLYTLDSTNLEVLLRMPGIISLQKDTKCVCVLFKSAHDKSITKLLDKEFGIKLQCHEPVYSYVLDCTNESILDMANKQLPKDFTIAPLQQKHGKAMYAAWGYGDPPPVSRFENTIKHQQHLAIYNEKGDPISWAVVKEYGDIGMTYTVPDYRRQGLASILTARLSQMVLQSHEIPFIAIAAFREASVALHTKLGFQRRGEEWTFENCLFHQNIGH